MINANFDILHLAIVFRSIYAIRINIISLLVPLFSSNQYFVLKLLAESSMMQYLAVGI